MGTACRGSTCKDEPFPKLCGDNSQHIVFHCGCWLALGRWCEFICQRKPACSLWHTHGADHVTVLRFLTLWLLVRQHQCRVPCHVAWQSCMASSPAKLLVLHGLFGPSPHSLLNDQLHMHSMHCSTFALLSQPRLRVHRS